MFDGRFRSSVDRGVGPIGSALGRTALSADHLTALGLVLAVPAALAIGTGRLALGLGLLIASAVPDLLDGALAKANGTASKRGAFFDSVADRVTDALILGGVAWHLQTVRHGHAALLPFAILGMTTLISYQRAKAESLGFTAKGGLMERAERIILLCIGLVAPAILVPILWAMLILISITAVQRFAKVWRQASEAMADQSETGVSSHAMAEPEGDGSAVGVVTGEAAVVAGAGLPRLAADESAPPDSTVAMAERWRAWRQQAAARQGGERFAAPARPTVGHGGDDSARPTRWEERRAAARLRADAVDKRGLPTSRRRHSTRRP